MSGDPADADPDDGPTPDAESYRVAGKADGDSASAGARTDAGAGAGPREAVRLPDGDGGDVPVVLADDVADAVDVDAIADAVPDDAPFTFDARGKADEDGTATIPVSGGVDYNTSTPTLSKTDFDRIRDKRIQRIRESSVDYDHRIADWIMAKDDLVPGISERMTALVLGEAGLQVDPTDADSDADKQLADWLTSEVYGEEVDPSDVVRTGIRENIKHARAVLRSVDLRDLELDKLTYVRDAMTGTEVYIQDSQSVTTLDYDSDSDDAEDVDVREIVDTEQVDQQLLEIGSEVFDVELYKNAPLEAVADDVVNKLVLKRLKARRAEIASIGGIYIKVNPPAGLPEEEYFSKEDVDWADEPKTKLEIAMRNGIEDAFETLSDYKAGSIMAIPENWEVNSVELPDDDQPLDEQIRGYNKSIANRLLFPLDLFELREGAELSRDTIFKTLLTTIEGWRQEFIRVFDNFVDVQKEIYDLPTDAEVDHSFPALGAEDEEILVQLLAHAGTANLSTSEVRQMMNRIEGVDLEIDTTAPDAPPAGGPSDPEERQRQIRDALPRDGDGDGVHDESEGGDGGGVSGDVSEDASRVLDDEVLGELAASGLESFQLGTVGGTFDDAEIDAAVDALQEIPGVDAKRSAENHDPGLLVTVDRSLVDRRINYDQRIADAVADTPFSVGDGESFDWEERAWASYVDAHSELQLDADFVSATAAPKNQQCWVCGAEATHQDTTPPYEFTCDDHAISIDAEPIDAGDEGDDTAEGGDTSGRSFRRIRAAARTLLESLTLSGSTADWNPEFHPRGPRGRFIDVPDLEELGNLDDLLDFDFEDSPGADWETDVVSDLASTAQNAKSGEIAARALAHIAEVSDETPRSGLSAVQMGGGTDDGRAALSLREDVDGGTVAHEFAHAIADSHGYALGDERAAATAQAFEPGVGGSDLTFGPPEAHELRLADPPEDLAGDRPAVDDLISEVNSAWRTMYDAAQSGDDERFRRVAFGSGYAATHAHETLAVLHGTLQQGDGYPVGLGSITEEHPGLFDTYLEYFDPSDHVKEVLNQRWSDEEYRQHSRLGDLFDSLPFPEVTDAN